MPGCPLCGSFNVTEDTFAVINICERCFHEWVPAGALTDTDTNKILARA